MSSRTVLRWLSGAFLAVGALGGLGRFIDPNYPIEHSTPMIFLGLGFAGVLALFWKD
jgi:hypothetical protein